MKKTANILVKYAVFAKGSNRISSDTRPKMLTSTLENGFIMAGLLLEALFVSKLCSDDGCRLRLQWYQEGNY
jgi:hypothetical protein